MTRDRINLSEKGESVRTELERVEVFNKFFSNIVNNLEISKYSKYESFIENIEDQTLGAILKYKNHPSIRRFITNSSFIITRPHRDFFVNNTAFQLIICYQITKNQNFYTSYIFKKKESSEFISSTFERKYCTKIQLHITI